MQLTQQDLDEFKLLWKDKTGEDIDNKTALDHATNLINYVSVLLKIDIRIQRWNARLVDSPKGIELPGNEIYNCLICHGRVSGNQGWYDKFGIKCLPCQKALEEKVIPESVCADRESWYDSSDLKRKFGLHSATVTKMVRTRELKARIIKNGTVDWFRIFMKNENEKLFDTPTPIAKPQPLT